jgi:Transglycosylase SLT domain
MQLMPATAKSLGVDPTDTKQNIEGGAKLFAELYKKYQNLPLALAVYNWNPASADRALKGHTSFPEQTQKYVASIMGTPEVTIDKLEINIAGTNATPTDIQQSVTTGIGEAMRKQTMQNLASARGGY